MKSKLVLLLGLGAFLQSPSVLAAASLTCSTPNFAPQLHDGRVYTFRVERTCTLSGPASGNFMAVRDAYIEARKANAVQIFDETSIPNGTKISMSEQVRTDQGDMTIEGEHFFTAEDGRTFAFRMESTKITATGNAKYTEKVTHSLQVAPLGSAKYSMKVSNQIRVKKPAFAPTDYFIRKVEEGLTKDILQFSEESSQIVASHL